MAWRTTGTDGGASSHECDSSMKHWVSLGRRLVWRSGDSWETRLARRRRADVPVLAVGVAVVVGVIRRGSAGRLRNSVGGIGCSHSYSLWKDVMEASVETWRGFLLLVVGLVRVGRAFVSASSDDSSSWSMTSVKMNVRWFCGNKGF